MTWLSEFWRVLFLRLEVLIKAFKDIIHRNSLIIKAITLAFFVILSLAISASVIVFSLAPEFSEQLTTIAQTALDYGDIPSPYTDGFFFFVFLNNIGHFWNPVRLLVWIPVLGPFLLGFEILLNSVVIGVLAVMVGITHGIAYPIVGLVPHGIIEIPAFLLQIAAIVLWQLTISDAIIDKLFGRKLERDKVTQRLRDTFVLAVMSIILLIIAAAIETYVTPYLIGL